MTLAQIAFAALIVLTLAALWHRNSISRGILARILELYLWLTPILSLALLGIVHNRTGFKGLVPIAVFHFAIMAWALKTVHPATGESSGIRLGGFLLIFGAALVWLGAVSFPGMGLEQVAARRADHLFTAAGFLAGSLVSLAGVAALRAKLREQGDALFSQLGLLALTIGTVCWILHLGFRATVMVAVARDHAAVAPAWYPPLRLWSGAMYAAYMFLAYLSVAAIGAALRKAGWAGKGWGRAFVVFGLLAAVGFTSGGLLGTGLPLMVQFMPYVMGMILLRRVTIQQATNP